MELANYLKLLEKQQNTMSEDQIIAISEQNKLHDIALQKMQLRDSLEAQYRELFAIGLQKLTSKYPNVLDLLPDSDSQVGVQEILFKSISDNNSPIHDISSMTKTIPELVECEKLNVKVAKAHFDFYLANDALNRKIEKDRELLFSTAYCEKMSQFAEDGVLLYFLETPDLPLLDEICTSNFILESFSFGGYLSARELFSSFCQAKEPGEPLKRKLEDARAALEMMYNGYYRSAARNWFSLIEHEHKRCADTLEGYWEAKKEYKNGKQRSEKIYNIIDSVMGPWDQETWDKINLFYKKLTDNPKKDVNVINRNSIIHGDYYNDSIDISENDAMKLFLLWINLRVIADQLAFFEDFMRNKVTILPYLCSLYPDGD